MTRFPQRAARRVAAALTGSLVLAGTALAVTSASAAPPAKGTATDAARPDSKIAPAVLTAFDTHATTDFWIRLKDHADTGKARSTKDRNTRGQQVVDNLQTTAKASQAEVRKLLDAKGVKYHSYWVSNAIRVVGGSESVARDVAALGSVAEVRAPEKIMRAEPASERPSTVAPNGVEWGLANINAPQVWATGDRGEGIVIATIDTGVQFDHPALVRSYRGNNGDGTFDHNYNWFDAQGSCGGAPCDKEGHGTHTMGTIVGDDGAGNQIGVAPGVKWITANGCCPSDEALMRSGQWMLAPTDLNGQNEDVSRRPHIVSNSWGANAPTNDPFLEDIQQAWADSGIFGVWANGNLGPNCNTAGSPGSRTLNYAVGAYDVNNKVASFSSRGPGQEGDIKPNIAAPGVDIRSSLPGSSYGLMSGTSMATPHVAGAVALLWAANPNMVRDIAGTRTALDLSAINTPDTQCGGDAEDNPVYGEGRLDAQALVQIGARGVGTLTGAVTASDTGKPLSDATVSVTGPINRQAHTGADGTYTLRLVPGDYRITVDGVFGYGKAIGTVTVTGDGTATHDVTLTAVTKVTLGGVVTDGGGHGWPLYAKVTATHTGNVFQTFTDPVTGHYTLPVVPDADYTLRVVAVAPGYTPAEDAITVGAGDMVEDRALAVDLSCTAPGYRVALAGKTETFDGKKAPKGWAVANVDPRYPGYQASKGWTFANPGGRENSTGGFGNMAIVDSDQYGQFFVQDATLTSPTVNLSSAATPAVLFATDLNPAVNSTATVEVSTDNGATWTAAWAKSSYDGVRGPNTQVVLLPQAANKAAVKVRFHYTGQWSQWWAVDDVFIGNRTCDTIDGGLVVGQVSDTVSGNGVTDATVTGVTNAGEHATTVSTPDDPDHGDGLYWLFTTAAGDQQYTATAPGHTPHTNSTTVTADAVTHLDFALATA